MDFDLGLGWHFRGQSDASKPLLPKAGRQEFFCRATTSWRKKGQNSGDLGRFTEWRHQAIAMSDELPSNDFECLAYAQHYGLATRLLDWSENPLVALFFAAEQQHDLDGAVFMYLPSVYLLDVKEAQLEAISRVALYRPRPFDRRIFAQQGVFTYHPDPTIPLEPAEVSKDQRIWVEELQREVPSGMNLRAVRVPAELKPGILNHLASVGVSRSSLFPDLEGLSQSINWQTRYYARGSRRK